ncbi:MAG: hypothetical protein QOG04_896 [Actinomycetota bacterium]|nr:hypothetical protein [Actinomycetota bacterium]
MATAVAVVLIATGVATIGVWIATQEQPVQPPGAALPSPDATERSDATAARRTKRTMPRSKPVTLDIPSINVHSKVQRLGQTASGALEVPSAPHYDQAAWYRYSPTPGSLGPAILLGHVDSADNGPSVFFRLGELKRGDRVSVKRANGSVANFVVDEVHSYSKNDFPTKVVYRDIDHAGLRMITCGGAFDDSTGHYLNNIVVFASLTNERDR